MALGFVGRALQPLRGDWRGRAAGGGYKWRFIKAQQFTKPMPVLGVQEENQ